MRKSLPCFSLLLGVVLLNLTSFGQTDRYAWAITDVQKDGVNWSYLRKLNLQNGKFTDVLLNGTEANQTAFDAISKKEITSFNMDVAAKGYNIQPAFSSGVAAMAYDRKNNRIWYTPMFIDQLRYIDARSMKVYYLTGQPFTGMVSKNADQGNIITRMTMADDGNGYALTNDGTHLIRFSSNGKNILVTDLGTLVDDPANKGFSIHGSCTSFGGDMIADNEGNLFIISARNYVFKVNIESKVAAHLGRVTGLPNNFTTNGAAVTHDNKVLISSATEATNSFFTVDMKTLAATHVPLADNWRSSDLANSNVLNTARKSNQLVDVPALISDNDDAESNKIQIYPNPVTNNQFAVHFNQLEPGEYTIQLADVMGRNLLQRIVNVSGKGQAETIRIDGLAAQGFYLIKVVDKNNRSVFSKKLVVQ